jgi:hypothetical protein
LVDTTTLGEVNNLIEFIDSEDKLEVVTAFATVSVTKRHGTFYVSSIVDDRGRAQAKATKLIKVPYLTDIGYFIMYPPSMSGREYVKTKEVLEIKLNGNPIYALKGAQV